MLKVGLTGGIASGKSFVSSVLAELGCHVFDADQIARNVVEPGTPALTEIAETFGPDVITAEGTLDRAKLGAVIFADPDARHKLNAITHPRIHAEQNRLIAEVAARDPNAVVVVDAALLIESGGYKRFDCVVVVWCRQREQIVRLCARNHLSHREALQRIRSQMPTREKLRYADYRIDTTRGFEDTRRQVEAVHARLRQRADALVGNTEGA